MKQYYILYNPLAGNGGGEDAAEALDIVMEETVVGMADMTKITNYSAFFSDKTECALVIRDIAQKVEYWPVEITLYLKDLPICEVKGRKYRFLNGVGFVKELLFHHKPANAVITVDGVVHEYKKVWIAPTMKGRFYGGGMMPTPDQDRLSPEGTLSILVFHKSCKLKTLMIFPSIFKGTHLKHTDVAEVLTGHVITVEFDRPTPLQIDGETIPGVTKYSVYSGRAEGELI